MYRETKKPRFPAVLGIYFCSHKDFTRFSRLSFRADGHELSYTRGNDKHDSLEFMLLLALLEESVHPAIWRLFPRASIPSDFRSDEYEIARLQVCRLLFNFRSVEMAARFTVDLPLDPLMICDESAKRLAIGDSKDEDDEIEKVIRDDAGLPSGPGNRNLACAASPIQSPVRGDIFIENAHRKIPPLFAKSRVSAQFVCGIFGPTSTPLHYLGDGNQFAVESDKSWDAMHRVLTG